METDALTLRLNESLRAAEAGLERFLALDPDPDIAEQAEALLRDLRRSRRGIETA